MIYEMTVNQFTRMLQNVTKIFDKAAQFADSKKIDMEVLLHSRLAPDQFHLIRQVQIACDTAKLGAARLAGKDAPTHEDNEKTLAELRDRIDSVTGYLKTFTAKDFVGCEERRVTTPRWEGKSLSGFEFFTQHVVPNFYFHVTTTYAILRHNGVDIGKKDYLGELPFKK
jgi:hypothetical protein